MIIDTLENASRYFMLHPSIEMAFDFLDGIEKDNYSEGKTEIIGNHLFANCMERETKNFSESIWESHEKYLDIHFLVDGNERIFYGPEENMTEIKPYDPEKDITVFEGDGTEVFFPKNSFVIFFPGEIHKALVNVGVTEKIKKVVVKLGVE